MPIKNYTVSATWIDSDGNEQVETRTAVLYVDPSEAIQPRSRQPVTLWQRFKKWIDIMKMTLERLRHDS